MAAQTPAQAGLQTGVQLSPIRQRFNDEFAKQRRLQGAGGTFDFEGKSYNTNRADDATVTTNPATGQQVGDAITPAPNPASVVGMSLPDNTSIATTPDEQSAQKATQGTSISNLEFEQMIKKALGDVSTDVSVAGGDADVKAEKPAETVTTTGTGLQEPTNASDLEKLYDTGGKGIDWLQNAASGLVGDAGNLADQAGDKFSGLIEELTRRYNSPPGVSSVSALLPPRPPEVQGPPQRPATPMDAGEFDGITIPNAPPPPMPSNEGSFDTETGITTMPFDSDNNPAIALANTLMNASEAQRANLLSQLDPETRDYILQLLDDRDNII